MSAASKLAYRKFLQSDFWNELSKRKRDAVGKCERCKSKVRLQCHHIRYPDDWFDTADDDLEVLCRKCHRKAHGIVYRFYMMHRDDERFSKYIFRVHRLIDMIYRNVALRPRDLYFLERAERDYPAEPTDTCMIWNVERCRELNVRMLAGEFKD